MQLTVKKFDVKKNYLTTKDLVGVDYKNPNIILPRLYGFNKQRFSKKQFISL
jgi:hypothetical protein